MIRPNTAKEHATSVQAETVISVAQALRNDPAYKWTAQNIEIGEDEVHLLTYVNSYTDGDGQPWKIETLVAVKTEATISRETPSPESFEVQDHEA